MFIVENYRPLLNVLCCMTEEQQAEFLNEFSDLSRKEDNCEFIYLTYMLTKTGPVCDRSPRIAKSPRKPLANPSYANLGVIEALASTDARRGTC